MPPAIPRGERRGRVGKRSRERHVSVRLLLAIAIAIPVALMGGLTAQAVLARTSCSDNPLVVNVAVADDIAPAIERVGQVYNDQGHQAAGQCARVHVTAQQPAAVAAQVDGQSPGASQPVDAWIPDSTLWVDVSRSYALGAKTVQPTGISVARSPLMIVMPPAAAAQVPEFNNTVGWNFLLPASIGGPPTALGLRLELPDPTQSAAGLSALAEISRLLGTGTTAARTQLTQFVLSAQSSAQFDDPASLAAFASQASPPLNGHPVTVTSEQAVLGYDAAHPATPLAAHYPSGGVTAALATPELDYPYVLTSSNPAEVQAARQFATLMRQSYAVALIRHDGFRSADGDGDTIPAGDGLAQQPLVLAAQAQPGEAQPDLQAWRSLQSGSRDLALMDVSSSMSAQSGVPGLTLEQELTESAGLGLALFPDSTQLGLWEFASGLPGSLPYKPLVAVGPLPGEVGLISRRAQIEQLNSTLRPQTSPAALNQAILAAYRQMTNSYQPGITNAVIVMTAAVDDAPGDLPVSDLVTDLKSLYKPDRPVELIIVVLGSQGNLSAMQQIAAAGGGAAFPVTNPAQIGQVFFEGVSRRICLSGGGCAA
jgi:hypothetical protein